MNSRSLLDICIDRGYIIIWNWFPLPAGFCSEFFTSVISAKECVNRPSFNSSFALEKEITQQEDHSVSASCWAFLCRSRAGSWPDLHIRVWGIVRLFLWNETSCVERYPSEATVFLLSSSSSTCFIFAGKPLVRQQPRAVESFSRNGSLTLCSGISVFKYPRIIDKWNN